MVEIWDFIKRNCRKGSKEAQKLDTSVGVTAGVTEDGRYSLCVQNYNGEPCLCIHVCNVRDGLHFSELGRETFVAAIGLKTIRKAIALARTPALMESSSKKG